VPDNNFDTDVTAELVEMLQFLSDWLAADRDARIALDRYIGRAHASGSVRDDLYRFSLLLGGTHQTTPAWTTRHRPDCRKPTRRAATAHRQPDPKSTPPTPRGDVTFRLHKSSFDRSPPVSAARGRVAVGLIAPQPFVGHPRVLREASHRRLTRQFHQHRRGRAILGGVGEP
jgi:hypothetical protein